MFKLKIIFTGCNRLSGCERVLKQDSVPLLQRHW